jgi:DNA polymerase III subunit epsilon
VIVFSGKLSMRRDKVAAAVAAANWEVAANVSARTTMLVLGAQDMKRMVEGFDKNTKERKATSQSPAAIKIRVVDESEFLETSRKSKSA